MGKIQKDYHKVTRQETKKAIMKELRKLKVCQVRMLIAKKCAEELEKIAATMDFTGLKKFFDDCNDYFFLEMKEIPSEYDVELMFYLSRCEYEDDEIFDGESEVKEYWKAKNNKQARIFLYLLNQKNICEFTITDFFL